MKLFLVPRRNFTIFGVQVLIGRFEINVIRSSTICVRLLINDKSCLRNSILLFGNNEYFQQTFTYKLINLNEFVIFETTLTLNHEHIGSV